jgi:hypothetical protein
MKHALRLSILEEMEIEMPESDKELIEDPFLILGYGVNAYLYML